MILRGDNDDPRSRFWAERAGAAAYVRKGRMAELVRVLAKTIDRRPKEDAFFVHLSGGSLDIRDRIARHLDAALFDSVIASEVRALAACGSFERLFDLLVQFLCQVASYRWFALSTSPDHFALHHHPTAAPTAEAEARVALGLSPEARVQRIVDEDPLRSHLDFSLGLDRPGRASPGRAPGFRDRSRRSRHVLGQSRGSQSRGDRPRRPRELDGHLTDCAECRMSSPDPFTSMPHPRGEIAKFESK